MKWSESQAGRLAQEWRWPIALVVAAGLLAVTARIWFPPLAEFLVAAESAETSDDESNAATGPAESIQLSEQAAKNIKLTRRTVVVEPFDRNMTFPAMVIERPGRTHVHIAAPFTGVVTGIYVVERQSVRSGDLMFEMRLTHEDLVQLQTEFLKTLGQIDVEIREIARLEKITRGVVAGTVLLERQYEKEKLDAALSAQREALRLHGLSSEQVDQIEKDRTLLRSLRISVPLVHADSSIHDENERIEDDSLVTPTSASATTDDDAPHALAREFIVKELLVETGQTIAAGQTLSVLADYSKLYVEGHAFEHDAEELLAALQQKRPVTAVPEVRSAEEIPDLDLVAVANAIQKDSRALHFLALLPNHESYRTDDAEGRRFITWKYKPGQRMQLRVPVERWKDVIVLPVTAIAEEGAEQFVFVENGDHFDRRPVHVVYRDQFEAVVANDGSLFPGEVVAATGAHQLQIALKNQSGGAVDPHHGHSH